MKNQIAQVREENSSARGQLDQQARHDRRWRERIVLHLGHLFMLDGIKALGVTGRATIWRLFESVPALFSGMRSSADSRMECVQG